MNVQTDIDAAFVEIVAKLGDVFETSLLILSLLEV